MAEAISRAAGPPAIPGAVARAHHGGNLRAAVAREAAQEALVPISKR